MDGNQGLQVSTVETSPNAISEKSVMNSKEITSLISAKNLPRSVTVLRSVQEHSCVISSEFTLFNRLQSKKESGRIYFIYGLVAPFIYVFSSIKVSCPRAQQRRHFLLQFTDLYHSQGFQEIGLLFFQIPWWV